MRGASRGGAVGTHPYAGRTASLATLHAKETAIGPVFLDRLAMTVEVASGVDTDALGTFTGEVPRAGTMREVAVAKARLGMAATGLAIGIASEGTYGPHPSVPFVPAGIELMAFVDDERGIVVTEHLIDEAPAFAHVATADLAGVAAFLGRIRFPDHAVIVRPNEGAPAAGLLRKGLRATDALARAIADGAAASRDGLALVQTDMRAHMNPTRMAAIGRLAGLLADRLATPCPACAMPGFGQVDAATGLPCERCGAPSGPSRVSRPSTAGRRGPNAPRPDQPVAAGIRHAGASVPTTRTTLPRLRPVST